MRLAEIVTGTHHGLCDTGWIAADLSCQAVQFPYVRSRAVQQGWKRQSSAGLGFSIDPRRRRKKGLSDAPPPLAPRPGGGSVGGSHAIFSPQNMEART